MLQPPVVLLPSLFFPLDSTHNAAPFIYFDATALAHAPSRSDFPPRSTTTSNDENEFCSSVGGVILLEGGGIRKTGGSTTQLKHVSRIKHHAPAQRRTLTSSFDRSQFVLFFFLFSLPLFTLFFFLLLGFCCSFFFTSLVFPQPIAPEVFFMHCFDIFSHRVTLLCAVRLDMFHFFFF